MALVLVVALTINFVALPVFFQSPYFSQPAGVEYRVNTQFLRFGYKYFTATVPVEDVAVGRVPQYKLPLDPNLISNFDEFKKLGFSDVVINKLLENGFVVTFYPVDSKDLTSFTKYYDDLPMQFPRFVTTDMVLHVFHSFFASLQMYFEVHYFTPWLNRTLKILLNNTLQLYVENKTASSIVDEAMIRLIAYLIVPLKILDQNYTLPPETPTLALQLANADLQNIESHNSVGASSIFNYGEDYTQYKPRGYYTYNETLERYFMAVMFLSRMYFPVICNENKTFSDVTTAMALTLTYLMLTSPVFTENGTIYAIDLYEKMYYITSFLVGYSDDLTFEDYERVIEDVYMSDFSLQMLTDTNKLQKAKNELKVLDHSKILGGIAKDQSETIGLRFIGQRFILDSYIFQNLIYDKVQNRYIPTSLDIPAVFNFSRARYHLRKVIQNNPDYKKNLENLTKEVAMMNVTQWTISVYNGWLYTLKAALRENYTGFPTFMQTDAWKDEKLNTFCGSWTELRHDTILYAKQSYVVPIWVPPASYEGFVEPLPLLWSRLKGLILQMKEGFSNLGLLPELYNFTLSGFYEQVNFLLNISLKELNNTALTKTELSTLFDFGKILSSYLVDLEDVHQKTTLVADVSTDPNTGQVLEEGTGYVHLLAVVVHDPKTDTLKIALGPVFSYYEFTQPMSNRLTDEEWAQMLSEGTAPEYPSWTASFLASSS